MAIERWGAFSVVDHPDARSFAAEVLLDDRLALLVLAWLAPIVLLPSWSLDIEVHA